MSKIKEVEPHQLKEWLESNSAILIDVREPHEYDLCKIKGATNIKLSMILAQVDDIETDKKIVLQCRSGVRSKSACKILQDDDFTGDIYNLTGGILAWQDSGYDVIQILEEI